VTDAAIGLVVKLGGSHADSPLLRSWLAALEGAGGGVVLVPGGGPFAETVRESQRLLGFDDLAAHQMALLAMAQFGLALVGLSRRAELVETEAAIHAALADHRMPVWSPWPMLRDAADVPASWDVTSDSLALWLAIRLRAPALVLVKRVAAAPGATINDLARAGTVDLALPSIIAGYEGELFVAGPADLPAVVDPVHPPGRRLGVAAIV
jgi:aspartokinase-like uncharacterized kinase